jgi:hypothetical protein
MTISAWYDETDEQCYNWPLISRSHEEGFILLESGKLAQHRFKSSLCYDFLAIVMKCITDCTYWIICSCYGRHRFSFVDVLMVFCEQDKKTYFTYSCKLIIGLRHTSVPREVRYRLTLRRESACYRSGWAFTLYTSLTYLWMYCVEQENVPIEARKLGLHAPIGTLFFSEFPRETCRHRLVDWNDFLAFSLWVQARLA